MMQKKSRNPLYPMIGLIVASFCLGAWIMMSTRPAAADSPTTQPADSAVNLRRTVTVQVVQKTKDAVVNISTRKLVDRRLTMGGGIFMPFATEQVVRVPANSLGSGFIIQRDGYVVTNNHVVDRAREISVELADGRKLPADLISADPDADLAVLRIHSKTPLPTLDLGDSSDLLIGEPVIAVGNPLGYSHSVSTGIVSALHRDIDPRESTDAQAQPVHGEQAALRDLIQTDAAINPGNSGGPLLNAYGQVIAINTAIRGDAQNIGFAIPIDRLRDLIPELMNPSQVTRVDVPLKLTEQRSITEPSTVNVTLASTAKNPQTLVAINGEHPANIVDAYAILLSMKANQSLDVEWAGSQSSHLTCQATPIPDAIVEAKQKFGLSIEQISPMLADKYHLSQEDGLLIDGIDRNSAADKCGLAPGDIIVQVGRVRVASLDDLGVLMPHLPEDGSIRVWVLRGHGIGYITLKF